VLVVQRHDSAQLHIAACICMLCEQLKQEIFEHPLYSPDLAPSHYRLFIHFSKFLGGQNLRSDQDTKDVVHN
jgi:hypothetical protein